MASHSAILCFPGPYASNPQKGALESAPVSLSARAWVVVLPLLVLPNLGPVIDTPAGQLFAVDLFVFPLLLLLMLSARPKIRIMSAPVVRLLLVLVGWCLLTIAFSAWRSGVYDLTAEIAAVGKLALLSLYAVAGLLVSRTVICEAQQNTLIWGLTGALLVAGGGLLIFRGPSERYNGESWFIGYESKNTISVIIAVLLMFLTSTFLVNGGSPRWKRLFPVAVVVGLSGLLLSSGRGGWLALAVAGAYLAFRLGLLSRRVWGIAFLGTVLLIGAYSTQEQFREELDRTIGLSRESSYSQGPEVESTIDTGSRLEILRESFPALLDHPLLGKGFRIVDSEADFGFSGSHNFWLEMFIETGVVGGLLAVAVMAVIWRQAVNMRTFEIPTRAAMLAAIIAGMTEVYLFTGLVLFFVLACYAALGGTPRATVDSFEMREKA